MSETMDIRQITEDELLHMELSRWIEIIDAAKKEGVLSLEQIRISLKQIATVEDIRYKYFYKCYASALVLLEAEREEYEKLVKRFHDFTVHVLEYYLEIFQDAAFEGEMEMLPPEARAAVALNDMFSRDAVDWEGKLSDLRACAKVYPALGNNIKRLANFIGEQMRIQEAQAVDIANLELLRMVEAMKHKVRFLSSQGMEKEALAIVRQMRQMVSQDRELLRMEQELSDCLENIVLSIALLCSGRSKTTEKCLQSLEKIREAVSCEVIIVDTGCDERVRYQLTHYADVITSFTWCDDFSKARNAGLALARGEWFLYLDDDEWFSNCEDIIAFFTSGKYKKYGAASYIQRNYLDTQGTQYTDSWVLRMIKLDVNTKFVSRIHEYLSPIIGETIVLHSIVEHFGYVYETEEALWAHYKRNSKLLRQMIKEEPEEFRWYMLLAQEYRTVRKWEKLYQLGADGLVLTDGKDSEEVRIAIGCFYGAQILAMKELGEHERGLEISKAALIDNRNTKLFQAFCALWMNWFCYWMGDYTEAIAHGNNYIKWVSYFEDKEKQLAVQRVAPFVADCFDIVMKKQVYSILICAGLRIGDVSFLFQYLDCLEWDKKQIYVFEDMIPTIVCVLKVIKETKEGKHLLQVMRGHQALWEYFQKELEAEP